MKFIIIRLPGAVMSVRVSYFYNTSNKVAKKFRKYNVPNKSRRNRIKHFFILEIGILCSNKTSHTILR